MSLIQALCPFFHSPGPLRKSSHPLAKLVSPPVRSSSRSLDFSVCQRRMLPAPTEKKAPALSPSQTLVDGKLPQQYSTARRYLLLVIFCLAQFLDAFNNSALFSAIPSLVRDLGFTEGESTWLISAFQLTFASFLLIVRPFPTPSVVLLTE